MPLKLIAPGRRKNNPHWLVRGTFDGHPVEVSTKTSTRRAAEAFLEGLPAALRASAPGRVSATFGEAVNMYLAWRNPRGNDRRYLTKLSAHLGSTLLTRINNAALVNVADELYPKGSNETKNRQVFTPAAAVMHYAADNDLCPWLRVKKLKEKAPEPRAVPSTIREAAIHQATGDLKLLLSWLFRMGTRITETLGVELENIDRQARIVKFYSGKTAQWLTLPVPDEVMALLPDHTVGPLFRWRTRWPADKARRKLCKRIDYNFTFHQCRHTFATELVNLGAGLEDLPHWRDQKSRARYGRPSLERQRDIMALLGKSGKIRGRRKKSQ